MVIRYGIEPALLCETGNAVGLSQRGKSGVKVHKDDLFRVVDVGPLGGTPLALNETRIRFKMGAALRCYNGGFLCI